MIHIFLYLYTHKGHNKIMTKETKNKPRIFLSPEQTQLITCFVGEKRRDKLAEKHSVKPSVIKKILWRQYAITPRYKKCIEAILAEAKKELKLLNSKV